MNNYTIEQLLNLQQVQGLLEAHVSISGIACGLVDNDGNIIIGAGLQPVCTRFLWEHPASFDRCWRNDPTIKQALQAFTGDLFECCCQNGMINIAMPIIVEGNRLAVFFSGQFFYEDAPPDLVWFQAQAKELGFDPESYLAAVCQAPLFNRSYVANIMRFLYQLVQLLAETGHTNLRRLREEERNKVDRERFLLASALNNSSDAVFLIDEQYRFRFVNDTACSSLGYSREELLNMTPLDIDPDVTLDQLVKMQQLVGVTGSLPPFETRHRSKDGRIFPVEICFSFFKHGGGLFSITTARNITGRKQMEAQLQQEVAFKQTLLNCISMVGIQVVLVDNGRIMYIGNREFAYSFGYTDAELDLYPSFIEIIHPDERKRAMDYYQRRLAGEPAPTTYEMGLITKSGERRDYEIAVIKLSDSDPVRIITVGKDISKRKRVEQQIKLLNHALDNVHEGAFLLDLQGRFLYVNQEACRSLGYDRNELLGMSIPDIDPDFSVNHMAEHFAELLEVKVLTFETRHCTRAGQVFPVEISISVLDYEGSSYFLALVRDITERKRAVEALQESEERFRLLVEQSPDLIFIRHKEQILYANPAAVRITGATCVEDLIGRSTLDFARPERRDYLERLMVANDTTPVGTVMPPYEGALVRLDGTTVPIELTAIRFRYRGMECSQQIMRDITERKRSEQVLQARLRILEITNQPMISLHGSLRLMLDEIESLTGSSIAFYHFLDEDQQTLSLQGWSTATLATFCKTEGADSHYPVARAGVWADAVRERKSVIHNNYVALPDRKGMPEGHAAVIRELVVPIFRREQIVAIIGVGNKPTDYAEADLQVVALLGDLSWEIVTRKKAETQLRESEEKFRTLAVNSPDSILRYDTACRCVYANPRIEKTLGLRSNSMLGKTPMQLFPDGKYRSYQDNIEKVLMSGTDAAMEVIVPDTGKGVQCHHVYFTAEQDVNGVIIGVLAIGHDITDRKRAEQELYEKQQKLTEMALKLSLAEERERRRIAAELHDHLSQSLLLGKMKLRALIGSHATANDQQMLEEMLALQDQMIRSVRSLTQQLSPPILAVAGLVDALKWLGERMLEDYGLRVLVVDDKKPKLLADDMRAIVFQSCRELLINVAKHAGTGTARVLVSRENELLYLAVEDQGAGFDPDGSASGATWDRGFGLFSIRERINYLGGSLVITSAPGQGTRVTLRVALAEKREVKSTTPHPPP